MSMKEIDKANAAKTYITRGYVYTIHQYTLTNILNTFQINHQQQACRADKYENAQAQAVTIEFPRRQERELSTLKTFCRLKVCAYKKARQSGQQSVLIPSAFCEVACLKIAAVKI